ncbi:hypothetical protein BC567DRAFT_2716 [Phyllosticta citribraziliensis]
MFLKEDFLRITSTCFHTVSTVRKDNLHYSIRHPLHLYSPPRSAEPFRVLLHTTRSAIMHANNSWAQKNDAFVSGTRFFLGAKFRTQETCGTLCSVLFGPGTVRLRQCTIA